MEALNCKLLSIYFLIFDFIAHICSHVFVIFIIILITMDIRHIGISYYIEITEYYLRITKQGLYIFSVAFTSNHKLHCRTSITCFRTTFSLPRSQIIFHTTCRFGSDCMHYHCMPSSFTLRVLYLYHKHFKYSQLALCCIMLLQLNLYK